MPATRSPRDIPSGSRRSLPALLAQPGCTGIRIYLAKKEEAAGTGESAIDLVLVGCDATGNDMCEATIMDNGIECPPFCGATSPLNS